MRYTIFTGIMNKKRFYDGYAYEDIEANESDYFGDFRYDFELSEEELQAKMEEFSKDDSILDECLDTLSVGDKKRFLRCLYRSEIEKDLKNDAVSGHLKELVLEDWKEDCLIEVKQKYEVY